MRIIDFFDQGATLYPGNVAFSDTAGQCSYREASEQIHLIASALHHLGFGRGTRIGILAPNCNIAFLALLGVFRVGAVWLPVNPRKTVAVNSELLDHFDSDLLLYHSVYEADARKIARRVPSVRQAVSIDGKGEFGVSLLEWVRHAEPYVASPYHSLDGTYSDNVRYLAVAPMAHSAGLLGCLHFARGGTHFIMATVDPGGILRAIQQHGITHLYAPPTLLHMMLIHPYVELFDYSSIQHFMIGAPVSVEELNHAIEIFGPVMTEIPSRRSQGQIRSDIRRGVLR